MAQFDVGIFWLEKSIEGEVPPTLFDGMMGVWVWNCSNWLRIWEMTGSVLPIFSFVKFPWNVHNYLSLCLALWLLSCYSIRLLFAQTQTQISFWPTAQLLETEPRPQDNWGHTADKSNNYAPINDNRPPIFPSIFTAVKADPSMSCKVKTRKSIYHAATKKVPKNQPVTFMKIEITLFF